MKFLVAIILSIVGLSGCDLCYLANKNHDYDRAIKECSHQINDFNLSQHSLAIAYGNRGIAYAEKGLFNQAIADQNKAIEIDPKLAFAYSNRGTVYSRQSLYEQAISDYTKAIELNPDFAPAYFNRAAAFKNAGRFSDAFNDIDKIISLNQEKEIVYGLRASVYAASGEFERASIDHDKAIMLNPKNDAVYDMRGSTYMLQGQYKEASDDFTKAIELNPKSASAYYNMACLFSLENDIDNACDWLKKSIDIGYNNWTHIKNDPDLSNIREAPCYQKIITEHAENPAISPVAESYTKPASEARMFSKGMTGLTFIFGRGTGFDNTYSIYGLRAGHFIRDGLEAGVSVEEWTGPSPRIIRASPDVRYVFYQIPYVKPYGGLFYRHSFVEGHNDINEIGARVGFNILLGKRSYLGAGIVYQSALDCSGDCTAVNPEIMAAILF